MARKSARGGSSPILMVLWIVFAILFIFSAVLAGLFYSQVNAAKANVANATKQLNSYATSAERSGTDVGERLAKGGSVTVVGSLQSELSQLKTLIGGVPDIATQALRDNVDRRRDDLKIAKDVTLLQEIERMHAEKTNDEKLVAQYKSASEAAAKLATDAEKGKGELTKNYDQSLAELKGQLTRLTAQAAAYQATVDNQRKALEDQLTAARGQAAQMATDKDAEIAKREGTIRDLQSRLALKPGGTTNITKPIPDPASVPDGKIVSILAEEKLAYIDLGKSDHLVPGMTFEVYDRTGITQNEFKEWRGKGTIEIVTINENSAVARIVRVARNKSITEGDLIANAVYDKNMKFKFVVFGDFDIDTIGQATTADRRRIESMISEWGGIIRPQLTYDVDFLVLGPEPKLPEPLPKGTPDPELIAKHTAQKVKFDAYQSLLVTAKELSIPVLNQNRFLALVGYYKR